MPQLILRSTDLETSGLEPPEAEIIEIGWTDVLWDTETRTGTIGATKSMLFAPTKPLEPANVAIHHLTNRMLSAYPVCDESDVRDMVRCGSDLLLGEPIYAFVAHNAAFENKWFTPEILGDVKTICTMKCAARLERESPTISNQGLRYYFDMDLAEEDAMPPHRAGPDSYVTAHILLKLLERHSVRDLVEATRLPRYYATFPFGKHKDQAFDSIPADYLNWVLRQPDMEDDIKAACRDEFERRRNGAGQ